MNSQLDVLAKLFVKFLVIVFVFRHFIEQLQTLLDDVFPDHLQDLVLLQHLTRNVQRQILRIHHTLNKVQVLWNEIFTIIHNEDTPHIQLDVVALLLLEQIKRCPAGKEKKSTELQLSFNRKVLYSQMLFPVISQALVEFRILLRCDLICVSHPKWLGLIQLLHFSVFFLDFLLLFLFFFLLFLLINIFNFGLFLVFLLLLFLLVLLFLILIITNFLVSLLLHHEGNGIPNELAVFLHNLFNPFFFEILLLVFFEVQNNSCSTRKNFLSQPTNSEGTSCSRLPEVLLIVIVLGVNFNLVRH
mmetsp:Transcript_54409/g.86543  ORF Transcript_54409/g.86543 Transcript_54409/m.86543 type:complete len:301 (+) Transcript_54409:1263-2165(+)